MKRLLLALLLLPAAVLAEVHYTLTPDIAAKSVRVSMWVDSPGTRPVFRIPRWCPGFYRILDYAAKISEVRATDGLGKALSLETGESMWTVDNPSGGGVSFSYRVLGDDGGLGFFGVSVIEHTAFVNGPAAFMYVDGRKEDPTRLTLRLPQNWEVAVALERDEKGDYMAGDYDELIDSPLQLGQFQRRRFTVEKIPYEAVYVSPTKEFQPNLEETTEVLRAVSDASVALMGRAPYKYYLYIVHLSFGNFGGGLEHRASTVLNVGNTRSLRPAHLAAHELFHVWNVKHIRPKVLGPFDYTQPNRTGLLWFAEGVTDYYAHVIVYRAGLSTPQGFLGTLTREVNSLQRATARLEVSIEEACRRTWESGGFGYKNLSYYNKGLLMGWILDAAIREATDGKKSLDDVMKLLFDRHELPKPGMSEDGVRDAVNEVAGKNLSALYDRIARSTEELPYEELLKIGLRVRKPNESAPSLGFTVKGATVIAADAAALDAGLQVGDVIRRVDGVPFKPGAFTAIGESFQLIVQRSDEQKAVRLRKVASRSDRWVVEIDPFASERAAARLEEWLARTTGESAGVDDGDGG